MSSKTSRVDLVPLFKAIQAAPSEPYQRYEWFIKFMGRVATSEPELASAAVALHEKNHPLLRRAVTLRGDLAVAVLQGLAFIAGRTDVLHRAFDDSDRASLVPESLDVLARFHMTEGDLESASDCYHRIESKVSPPYYALSRLASLSYCRGDIPQANSLYARFLSFVHSGDTPAPGFILEPAKAYAMAVKGESESFAANEEYWADKGKIRNLIDAYELELVGGWPYRTVARQINHAATSIINDLSEKNRDLAVVINYGSFCGATDFERAEAMPELRWFGFDRETLAIEYSRERFRRENLVFLSGAYEDALAQTCNESKGRAALIHTRSTCEMTPAKVSHVYGMAARYGVEWIAGAEFIRPVAKLPVNLC